MERLVLRKRYSFFILYEEKAKKVLELDGKKGLASTMTKKIIFYK